MKTRARTACGGGERGPNNASPHTRVSATFLRTLDDFCHTQIIMAGERNNNITRQIPLSGGKKAYPCSTSLTHFPACTSIYAHDEMNEDPSRGLRSWWEGGSSTRAPSSMIPSPRGGGSSSGVVGRLTDRRFAHQDGVGL